MWTATRELSVFAPIADKPTLRDRLLAIDAALDDAVVPTEPFAPGLVPDTHFMRFVIIEDEALGDLLAWELNYDGHLDDYLAKVIATPGLDRILGCCERYPGVADREAWFEWIHAHRIRASAFYVAYPGVPRRRVVNDLAVAAELRRVVDTHRAELVGEPGHEIQRLLGVAIDPELDTSTIPDEELRFDLGRTLAVIAGAIVFVPLLAIVVVWWFWALLIHEARDGDEAELMHSVRVPPHLASLEDKVRQNQLTHVVDIKPGFFRMFTIWTVLQVIGVLSSQFYVNGSLGGITSIHFARWVIVRDRRKGIRRKDRRHRLVFFSNYDGSWESYLGEFIDRASMGLTAIWCNTVGFPKTKFLCWAGARDEERFKQWTRDHQIATQMWWSGVPDSTVQNVRDDVWLRNNLMVTLDAQEMTTWLRRI